MKTIFQSKQHILVGVVFLVLTGLHTLNAQPGSWIPPGTELHAKGTGRTTGHIVTLSVTNTSSRPVNLEVPPLVIPSDGTHQGYAVPEPTKTTVPGNSTVTVPINGYCTDFHLPAPGSDVTMPPPNTWITGSEMIPVLQKIITTTTDHQQKGHFSTPLFTNPQTEAEVIVQFTLWWYSYPTTFDPCLHLTSTMSDWYRDTDWFTSGTPNIEPGISQIVDAMIRVGRDVGLPDFTPPALPDTPLTPAGPSTNPSVTSTIRAYGTGRTTGHICDLTITNPTKEPVNVQIGNGNPIYIPAAGNYQPYVVPSLPAIRVPAGGTVTVPVEGFCADVRRPPVSLGESMPPIQQWISGGTTNSTNKPVIPDPMNPSGVPGSGTVVVPTRTAPPLTEVVELLDNGLEPPILSKWNCPDVPFQNRIYVPGTEQQIHTPILPEKNPAIAVPILLEALSLISRTYDELKPTGAITTPFSNNPPKEREAVIQQTFWMYSAALRGEPYHKDDFRDNTIRQFEQTTGRSFPQLPESQQDQIDKGVDDFWNTFQATGAEAKILPKVPEPPKTVPNPSDIFEGAPLKNPMSIAYTPDASALLFPQLINDRKKKDKKEDKQCQCGMVKVKLTAWDWEGDELRGKTKDNSAKSEIRDAFTSDGTLDVYDINIGKDKIPANQFQRIMIYIEKVDCPCVNLAAEGVQNALSKLKEAEEMKVGGTAKVKDVAKLEEERKKLEEKKKSAIQSDKKIEEIKAKVKAIKDANDAIAAAKLAAKTSDCPVINSQDDFKKKKEERKKEPNIRVYATDNKTTYNGKWGEDSRKNKGYTFTLKKTGKTPMEFKFDLSFHCQDDNCKGVTCKRTFKVQVDN